ncbi:FecR family protein [Pseudoxanthomonas putridarboris]|uniref:FecR domain-containing protein n=1 Tax=Pseudoxanthomonas putridarboris TaxID=752605 RepID=A0ABU9IVP9_9GAMM
MNGRSGELPIAVSAGVKDNMKSHDDKATEFDLELDPCDPDDQAYLWVSRLASGQADADTLLEFERWRDSDSRNEAALAKARKLWLMMGGVLEARYAPALESMPIPRARRRSQRPWQPLLATAATLLLTLGFGHQWGTNWRYDEVSGTGEQRAVALADGSTMWLNTGSAADIQIDAAARHVTLARGEAYFDVTRDARRPFVINAGPGQIKVLGTAFGVYRDGDDTVVTVQRGRVEVTGLSGPQVVLTTDQSVRVTSGGNLGGVELVDASRALAWRTGRVMFENRPISQVFEELRRYDKRIVVVRYPKGDNLRVSSVVDLARLDEWYDTLGQSLPVEVKRMGPVVWISEAAKAKPNG